jgi:S-formylglutathione hydrolase FrmB
MRTLLALATALVLAAPSVAHADDLVYKGTTQLSPRLQELTFTTPVLEPQETGVRILYPQDYDASGNTRYPVLYLLNGSLDDQTAWTTKGDAEKISAPYQLIIVMPSGGQFGNYTDWYNDGAYGPPEWETYHINQLIPWIDAHLPTDGTRAGRWVAGLSMGGGGAASYQARHADLFSAVGIFSGAVDTNNVFVQPLTANAGTMSGHPEWSVYGPRATEEVRWRGHNGWDLAENLRGAFIQIDTGDGSGGGPGGDTGDPVEADVYQQSVALHRKLDELGIAHIWNYYGAGGHAWYYWNRDLSQLLPRLMALYADGGQLQPDHFAYTAIEPSYDVYGWHVAIERPALEFSTLRQAGSDGFALSGSGKALVTTPRYWKPGARLAVTVGDRTQAMAADDKGRLTVPIELGPANPYQQYSPQAKAWMAQNNIGDDTGRAVDEAQRWPVFTKTVRIATAKASAAAKRKATRERKPRHRRTRRAP